MCCVVLKRAAVSLPLSSLSQHTRPFGSSLTKRPRSQWRTGLSVSTSSPARPPTRMISRKQHSSLSIPPVHRTPQPPLPGGGGEPIFMPRSLPLYLLVHSHQHQNNKKTTTTTRTRTRTTVISTICLHPIYLPPPPAPKTLGRGTAGTLTFGRGCGCRRFCSRRFLPVPLSIAPPTARRRRPFPPRRHFSESFHGQLTIIFVLSYHRQDKRYVNI